MPRSFLVGQVLQDGIGQVTESDLKGGAVVHQLIDVKADAVGDFGILVLGQRFHQRLFMHRPIIDVVDVEEAVS
jgi:hypothetical protein